MYSKLEISQVFMNCHSVAEANKAWKAFRLLLVYHAQPHLHFLETEYRARRAVLAYNK